MPEPANSISTNSISANLERLRNQIADTCARRGRSSADVALMAVSKMHPAEAIREAHAAGQRLFGENRVQEWQSKARTLADLGFDFALPAATPAGASAPEHSASAPVNRAATAEKTLRMHLIGPLQNNKTSRAAELFHSIDTIDSVRTGQRLDAAAQSLGSVLPVLIEVKLSPEESKHGVAPEDLPGLLSTLASLRSLRLSGLMTVPPWSEDPEVARPYFQRLRRLRDENLAQHPRLTELSMGMSNDFRVAIEEGSTTVRLGTAIFGKRNPPPAAERSG